MTTSSSASPVLTATETTAPVPEALEGLKKTTLAEGLEKTESSVTLTAGRVRGEMTDSGFTLKTTSIDLESDPMPTVDPVPEIRLDPSDKNDDEPFLTPSPKLAELRLPVWVTYAQNGAVALSVLWLAGAGGVVVAQWGTGIVSLLPHELGGVIAGVLAPVALLWLALSHITRTHDAQRYGEALRAELHALIFPSEERQQRISHDIEKLCQQSAQLEVSSRTSLKAIQKSRQAMREETREFLLLIKKAELHMDQLTKGLNGRVESLASVMDQIEQRTAKVDQGAAAGITAWDQAASVMMTRADQIEAALNRGSEKLLGASDTATTKAKEIEQQLNGTFDHLEKSIDNVAGRLDTLSTDFDTHGNNLSRATERVVDETARLGTMIESQIRDLQAMSEGVFEAVAKSSSMVKDQREILDAGAVALSRQAEEIAARVKQSGEALRDTTTDLVIRAGDVEGRINHQAQSLQSVLDGLESRTRTMEQTGASLAERLSEALSVALSGSETLSSAVRRAVETLQTAAGDARTQAADIVRTTTASIDAVQQNGAAQAARAENVAAMLAAQREALMDHAIKAESQASQVLKLYEEQSVNMGVAVSALTEKLISAAAQLDSPLRAVTHAVGDADRRHEMIEQTLTRRVEDLTRASDKARETAETIQTLLRAQAQEMSILSGQIAGQVRTISDQIGSQKDALSSQVERTVQDLDHVRAAITRQAETLNTVSSDMGSNLSRLHDRMAERTQTLRSDAEGLTTRLYDLDEKMAASTANLAEHTARLRETADKAATTIDTASEHAEPIYRRLIDQASTAMERFELLHRTYDSTATSNLERLAQIAGVFDERLSSLRLGVTEAAQILRNSGDELRARVDDIDGASKTASDRMNYVSQTLQGQINDIHLLTDQALIKVENIQKAIEQQFQDLNTAVGRAISELQGAETQFSATARQVDTTTETSVRKMQAATRDTVGESNVLQGAAAAVIKTTQDMVATLQAESKAMLQSAGDTLMDIKKIADGFALRSREVEEHMKSSLSTAQTYGRDLKSQAGSIAEASVDTADKIARAITQMNGKIIEVERAALSVGEKVEQMRGKLEGEAARFMSTAKQAVDAAEEASGAYARQSNVLFKAAQEAVAQIDKIKDVQGRAQRDAFLSSAKFVIESLHSLAVDFVRVLDGGVDDKTWKAFQKGDVAAFTRRLTQNMDALPMDKVRAKFAGDSEFRGYVQRFVRLFEDMFDQAIANDHGELLSATFLSSDVGKLYQVLCTATGREAKAGRDLAKAA